MEKDLINRARKKDAQAISEIVKKHSVRQFICI